MHTNSRTHSLPSTVTLSKTHQTENKTILDSFTPRAHRTHPRNPGFPTAACLLCDNATMACCVQATVCTGQADAQPTEQHARYHQQQHSPPMRRPRSAPNEWRPLSVVAVTAHCAHCTMGPLARCSALSPASSGTAAGAHADQRGWVPDTRMALVGSRQCRSCSS